MAAYYNENDPYCAAWLRNLIAAGHIAAGDVDERSIVDVRPDDVRGYTQCHWFAGIAGWSQSLKLAGWPDDKPVWTGSCPCQPLSCAGQRKGNADERHIWPAFYRLISECAPAIIFGEQVASKDGREWLCAVRADLEDCGYAIGAADLCAARVGAPHIRQRLFWMANANSSRCFPVQQNRIYCGEESARLWNVQFAGYSATGWMADTDSQRLAERGRIGRDDDPQRPAAQRGCENAGSMADADGGRSSPRSETASAVGYRSATVADGEFRRLANADSRERHRLADGEGCESDRATAGRQQGHRELATSGEFRRPGPLDGVWRGADWLGCRDGKWRPVEPGTFPLAARLSPGMGSVRPGEASPFRVIVDPKTGKSVGQEPWRIGMLRAYGNAICPQTAAEFIKASMP